jgi:hypothetical protein
MANMNYTNKKINKFACVSFVLFLILTLPVMVSAKKLKFQGERLYDSQTGLTILPAKEESIFISSRMYGFMLVLPYSKNWEIELRRHILPFEALHPNYIVTIRIFPKYEANDQDYLEKKLDDLRGSGKSKSVMQPS